MKKHIARIVVVSSFILLGVALGLSILDEKWEFVLPVATAIGVLIVLDLKYFNPMNK